MGAIIAPLLLSNFKVFDFSKFVLRRDMFSFFMNFNFSLQLRFFDLGFFLRRDETAISSVVSTKSKLRFFDFSIFFARRHPVTYDEPINVHLRSIKLLKTI
jgi:hypothetical protein